MRLVGQVEAFCLHQLNQVLLGVLEDVGVRVRLQGVEGGITEVYMEGRAEEVLQHQLPPHSHKHTWIRYLYPRALSPPSHCQIHPQLHPHLQEVLVPQSPRKGEAEGQPPVPHQAVLKCEPVTPLLLTRDLTRNILRGGVGEGMEV